jgi:hypothetical protein
LSSKPGADPNALGAAKASGDEEAKEEPKAPKVYEDKLWKGVNGKFDYSARQAQKDYGYSFPHWK